jgi:hypothetical protein
MTSPKSIPATPLPAKNLEKARFGLFCPEAFEITQNRQK